MTTMEVIPPQVPSLPVWPQNPDAVDPCAAAYLVIAIGSAPRTADVAAGWVQTAQDRAPTRLLVLDSMDDEQCRADLALALAGIRTGARIMITGGQYDVLTALAAARAAGATPAELTSFVVNTDDVPIFCAHCRGTFRVLAGPGDEVQCPGCARILEIHEHFASALGSFLASDARAREI
ncbi:hypothetical protein ASJ79_15075 [Mycobacterium sp. NAZ190054]|nr:hypothetical protein ASJ79_15075 [Mycobacterium sp. NAZ190054]